MRLGAHMSIAGGAEKAFDRGESIGCETMQMFVTSPSRWQITKLKAKSLERFPIRQQETGIEPVLAHARYLLNLGSPDDELWSKSIDGCYDELERCETLSIPYLCLHPGAHMEEGVDAGIQRVVAALNELRQRTSDYAVKLLLETTAGQGTVLGATFEELAQMIEMVDDPSWLGVCLDTCHIFAAGYDLRDEKSYTETWRQFEKALGLDQLYFIHLNDSKGCLDCHLDRHEHIGKGELGLEAFRFLMNDPRLQDIPMVLETPKGPEMEEDVENLAVLRGLITD